MVYLSIVIIISGYLLIHFSCYWDRFKILFGWGLLIFGLCSLIISGLASIEGNPFYVTDSYVASEEYVSNFKEINSSGGSNSLTDTSKSYEYCIDDTVKEISSNTFTYIKVIGDNQNITKLKVTKENRLNLGLLYPYTYTIYEFS